MKIIQILSLILISATMIPASTQLFKKPHLAERLFGKYGAQLDAESIERAQNLFNTLSTFTKEQRVVLAYTLEDLINEEHVRIQHAIKTIIKDGGIVSQAQYYIRFITVHEHKHLKKYLL